ncbi:TPR end-of-group domain-containing protein [Methylotuvimicrobium buryatense]|uniref:Tetratricopeptide repeat protein n=1 Tax=Methylotuvimicrobium buryatense TaxID=95641 RepID=A0A4P9ULN7_METBY|nr:tetratricopeptide repeat protein [Methylotuvimicrobium buryatense]QCW81440.1 tetratricopeptide repeat protein [Methylotuvimicrobium buryatense]
MLRILMVLILLAPCFALAELVDNEREVQERLDAIESLDKPLYSPFIERYMLDELKQLRTDMATQRNELIQQIVDRELSSVDRGVTYATNTVTYFFYLIAGASTILVLLGWTSLRDIKERVQSMADKKVSKLVHEYEERLAIVEQQLNKEAQLIEKIGEDIERTQDVQSLWLRAGQASSLANKIAIYDQILKLRPEDCEALTYKADAVLDMGEPQWAVNLCQQALKSDPENGHAFYQLACAYTALNQYEEAVNCLSEALERTEDYRDKFADDPALEALKDFEPFIELLPSEDNTH